MMKKFLIALILITTPTFGSTIDYFEECLEAHERKIILLKNYLTDASHIVTKAEWEQLDLAILMYNIKRTLVANFYGMPSLESEEVREKLFELLESDLITAADLAELQFLIDQFYQSY